LATVLAAVVVGCGDDASRAEDQLWAPRDRAQAESEERAPPLYDAEGNLLPSGEKIAGLELPRGLAEQEELSQDRRHTFHSEVPMRKLQEFFGTRLITGEVDRLGGGAVYRNAVPKGVRGGVVRMDVSILPMRGGDTRVQIDELPPTPDNPPSEAEYLEALERDAREME